MGWCYNHSRRSGTGWFSHWKIWTEGCEKHWMEWWEIPPTAWRSCLQSKVFGRLEYQRGAKIFFAKRRSRIRPSILRPAPPEWTKVLLVHHLHSLGVSFTTTRATEFAFSVPQWSGCTITSEASSENVLSSRRSNIISWNNPLVLTSRKVRLRGRR